jgi:hypothetical protein
MVMIDRSEVSRALAKAIAFKQCGKDEMANHWAAELVRLLDCADIVAPHYARVWQGVNAGAVRLV